MNTTHTHTTSQLSHTYLKGRIMHRGRMIHCTLLAAGLLIGLLAPAAQSATVFSDDFDGETVGNDPSQWTDNSSDTNADVSVSSTEAQSPSNSMLLDDDTSGAAIANATFSEITSGIVEWEFSFFETATNTDPLVPGLMRARLGNSSEDEDNGLLVITAGDGSGNVLFRQSTTETNPDTVIGTIALDEWNTVRVVGDLATQMADVYFNGALAVSDQLFRNTVSSFDALQFDSSAGLTGDLFIDDVSVTVIPEPASLGLLGLGGAVMLSGRRRRG